MIINSIVHLSNKNPLIVPNTSRMCQGSLKLYPHSPEWRLHRHSLWPLSLCPERVAGAHVWPRHCTWPAFLQVGVLGRHGGRSSPLCCGAGRACAWTPGAALCCVSKTPAEVMSIQKLLLLLLAAKSDLLALPLCLQRDPSAES